MSIGVVGGGPTGIFTATLLASAGKSVTLFQKGNLGGNHRVDWVGDYSTQFARYYSNGYVNYINVLRHLGINFDDFYVESKSNITTEIIKKMPLGPFELLTMFYFYLISMILKEKSKKISMQYVSSKFKPKSKVFIDQLCKVLDGVGSQKLSCWSFFSSANVIQQQYHPSVSSDILWEKIIGKFKQFNGEIVPENVAKLVDFGLQTTGGTNWYFNKIVLCTPPKATLKIMKNSVTVMRDAIMPLENLETYTEKSSYPIWIQFTINFNIHVDTKRRFSHGLDGKEWCIISLILSDYMEEQGTVISCCTSTLDKVSETGLIANDIDSSEVLLKEASRQVLQSFNISEEPAFVVLNPKVTRENGKWITSDIPFVFSIDTKNVPASTSRKNLYWVGQQNGHGTFGVTTLETVCENVVPFCLEVSPNLKKIKVKNRYTISRVVMTIILCVMVIWSSNL